MKIYVYNGDGACLPGLPKQITEFEAGYLNDEETQQLQAALASGLYIETDVVGAGSSSPVEETEVEEHPRPKSQKYRDTFLTHEGEQP